MALVVLAAVLPVVALRQAGKRSVEGLPIRVRTRLDLLGGHSRDFGSCVVGGELRIDAERVVANVQGERFALELGERVQSTLLHVSVHAELGGLAAYGVVAVARSRGVSYRADAMARVW